MIQREYREVVNFAVAILPVAHGPWAPLVVDAAELHRLAVQGRRGSDWKKIRTAIPSPRRENARKR